MWCLCTADNLEEYRKGGRNESCVVYSEYKVLKVELNVKIQIDVRGSGFWDAGSSWVYERVKVGLHQKIGNILRRGGFGMGGAFISEDG